MVKTRIGTVSVYEHTDKYDEATRWAVSMADQMEHRIDVVPMGFDEFVKSKSGMTMDEWLKSLPAATLEEFRQLALEACADALRDCPDPTVRAEAAYVLVKLGAVR